MKAALILLVVQGLLGAFDTLYFHEWKLRLPAHPRARLELTLHAARDFFYAVLLGSIPWVTWDGALAWVFAALLLAEIVITLWDFVEEDSWRVLPGGERVMHTVMALVYGGFLAKLIPEVAAWSALPTAFRRVDYGWLSRVLTVFAAGVLLSGVRDLLSSRQHEEAAAGSLPA